MLGQTCIEILKLIKKNQNVQQVKRHGARKVYYFYNYWQNGSKILFLAKILPHFLLTASFVGYHLMIGYSVFCNSCYLSGDVLLEFEGQLVYN